MAVNESDTFFSNSTYLTTLKSSKAIIHTLIEL